MKLRRKGPLLSQNSSERCARAKSRDSGGRPNHTSGAGFVFSATAAAMASTATRVPAAFLRREEGEQQVWKY